MNASIKEAMRHLIAFVASVIVIALWFVYVPESPQRFAVLAILWVSGAEFGIGITLLKQWCEQEIERNKRLRDEFEKYPPVL
jgi:hypothetical protein